MPLIKIFDKENETQIFTKIIGNGIPIVLIHGWLCSSEFWEDFHILSGKGYQLIIPDLRGHGKSPIVKDVSIESHAKDINTILEFFSIKKAIIIGHSMGGLVAQSFYCKYPQKIIALGLWDTAGKMPFGYGLGALFYQLRIISFIILLMLTYPFKRLFKFILSQGWKLAFKDKGKSIAYRKYISIVKSNSPQMVIKSALSLTKFNNLNNLEKIIVPTMIVHGCKDRYIIINQMSKKLHEKIKNSKLYYIKESGHFPPIEQPDNLLIHLYEFLNTIE